MKLKEIAKKHSKAVTHLRTQKKLDRLGLVFGAGISTDFGFPKWDELIQRIASDERVKGEELLKKIEQKTLISQLLFQNYRAKEYCTHGADFLEYDKFNSHVQAGWHKIIHDALYRDVPKEIEELKQKDSYLYEYLDIIKEIKLTVNYNFDNTIQLLLAEKRTPEQRKKERGYRTVWNSDIQLYPQRGVLYHPNGFLPNNARDRTSENLIFLDDSFGDQLIDSVAGHYSTLSYYFSQNTCIFLGLSLEDATLKHLLRKNANMHPGHVHYYIHYLEDENNMDDKSKKAIIDANFEVYNLVTLFLNKEGIKSLAQAIKCPDEDFEELCDRMATSTSYRYFLTGSVSVGKSTAVSHFRSLQTHDEWLENRIEGMEKDPRFINEKEMIEKIDQWVADQWRKKNFALSRTANHGIHIIDRCPLDAFAFTPEDQWAKKANFTITNITPAKSKTKLVNGTIILLLGDPDVMEVRALKLQKIVESRDLRYRQELLKKIYNKATKGIIWLDTKEKSAKRIAKEISKIIHIDDYVECIIQERLNLIKDGKVIAK